MFILLFKALLDLFMSLLLKSTTDRQLMKADVSKKEEKWISVMGGGVCQVL